MAKFMNEHTYLLPFHPASGYNYPHMLMASAKGLSCSSPRSGSGPSGCPLSWSPLLYLLYYGCSQVRGLADTWMPTAGSHRVGGRIIPGGESTDGTAVAWDQHEWDPASLQRPLEALLRSLGRHVVHCCSWSRSPPCDPKPQLQAPTVAYSICVPSHQECSGPPVPGSQSLLAHPLSGL